MISRPVFTKSETKTLNLQRLTCWHASGPGVVVLDDRQSKQDRCYAAPEILRDACDIDQGFSEVYH